MTSAEILVKMIGHANGHKGDIAHFLKVYGYARNIGECEGLDETTQKTVEVASIIHDIAIPLCRVKYGDATGYHQEIESEPLVREFLAPCGLAPEMVERIVFLVSHHHSPHLIDGIDFQILIEADYLVNADESAFSEGNIRTMYNTVFKTETGKALLKSIYQI